jgi:hypothetical protein
MNLKLPYSFAYAFSRIMGQISLVLFWFEPEHFTKLYRFYMPIRNHKHYMFVSGEIIINMDNYRLSILEEHHCIEAIFFVLKALRMEYSLDEITASVRNHTES